MRRSVSNHGEYFWVQEWLTLHIECDPNGGPLDFIKDLHELFERQLRLLAFCEGTPSCAAQWASQIAQPGRLDAEC